MMDRYIFLKEIAYEFRKALEIVVEKGLYGRLTVFRSFPRGCCRYASDLLAEYLMNNGIENKRIQMVEGELNECGYTHCWLVVDNAVYVDITADQFEDKPYFQEYEPIPSCYVVSCEGRSIHELFDNDKEKYLYKVGIDSYNEDISMKLHMVYDAVIQQIENKWRR